MRNVLAILFSITPLCSAGLIQQRFDNSPNGWVPIGSPDAKVSVIHDPTRLKQGSGALEIRYQSSSAKPGMAFLPISQSLAEAKSINAWLMTDVPMAIAVVLSEKNGGRYSAISWVEPLEWKRIELTPADFALSTNPQDPPDPDKKLDLDQVEAVAILDLSQILSGFLNKRNSPIVVDAHEGEHWILMDSFEISSEAPAWSQNQTAWQIDTFKRPQSLWFGLGGITIRQNDGVMQASYRQFENRLLGLVRVLPGTDLTGATHLAFDIGSDLRTTLFVTLEEKVPGKETGPRYRSSLVVEPGGKINHHELPLAKFKLEDNGPKDPNDKLDLDQIKTITIFDIIGLLKEGDAVNTLRISKVELLKHDEPTPTPSAKK